ncbi:hypothetical protein RJ640_019700 [Escallonia rubra]|uniref:PPM-type phosphatase domain-containing protein n=1 Tax=Escallonia rubra TaxID=112253 RepID=A0AA88RQM7_9ASTE|nr:hypothetical protein RJ640_019700 [Escallonia rubra]
MLTFSFGTGGDGVGVVAVLDGHGSKEAGEMASKLLLDYYYFHAIFGAHSLIKFRKEPVLRAIHEIEIEFTTYFVQHIRVPKLGTLTWPWKYRKLKAKELSRDHHPDRANERARIEAAGGFVRVHASTALSRSHKLLAM